MMGEQHPLEQSPLTQMYHIIWKKRNQWWMFHDKGEESPYAFRKIPDTIVWENNIPKGWYRYDAKEGYCIKRKVETRVIERHFLANITSDAEIVASVIYDSTEGSTLHVDFLNRTRFEEFLTTRRKKKQCCLLQKFIPPQNRENNDMIQAIWSPKVVMVNRRRNVHNINDSSVSEFDRAATFEGPSHLSRIIYCTPKLVSQVRRYCDSLVQHFRDLDPRNLLNRMVLFFKVDSHSRLYLCYASSIRVISAAKINSVPYVALELSPVYSNEPPESDDELPSVLDSVTVSGSAYDQRRQSRGALSVEDPAIEKWLSINRQQVFMDTTNGRTGSSSGLASSLDQPRLGHSSLPLPPAPAAAASTSPNGRSTTRRSPKRQQNSRPSSSPMFPRGPLDFVNSELAARPSSSAATSWGPVDFGLERDPSGAPPLPRRGNRATAASLPALAGPEPQSEPQSELTESKPRSQAQHKLESLDRGPASNLPDHQRLLLAFEAYAERATEREKEEAERIDAEKALSTSVDMQRKQDQKNLAQAEWKLLSKAVESSFIQTRLTHQEILEFVEDLLYQVYSYYQVMPVSHRSASSSAFEFAVPDGFPTELIELLVTMLDAAPRADVSNGYQIPMRNVPIQKINVAFEHIKQLIRGAMRAREREVVRKAVPRPSV